MKRYFLDFKWRPTRRQIMASYRLSADKHPANQLGENHVDASARYGLYSVEFRQQLKQLFLKIRGPSGTRTASEEEVKSQIAEHTR